MVPDPDKEPAEPTVIVLAAAMTPFNCNVPVVMVVGPS